MAKRIHNNAHDDIGEKLQEATSKAQLSLQVSLGKLVEANLYRLLGADYQVTDADKFNYIYNGYMRVPYMYEAVGLIVNKLKQCPVLIYELKDDTKTNARQKYQELKTSALGGDHSRYLALKSRLLVESEHKKIRNLLDNPNPNQTFEEFLSMASIMLLSTGNALIYGVSGDARSRSITEMWSLPVNPLQYKIVSGGMFDPVKEYNIECNDSKLNLSAESVLHLKHTNPNWDGLGSDLYGMSPFRPYIEKLMRSQLGDEAANKLLKNGFKMGIISPKRAEDQFGGEQKTGMAAALKSLLKKSERFAVSNIALDYVPIGLDATDLSILELSKADREDVYRALHIPLTRASNDAATYNNMRESNRQLVYDAIAPWCELLSDQFTRFICDPINKAEGKNYVIRFDYMSLPELATDMKEASEWLSKSPHLTPNEKREAMGWGRLDMPGMDEPIYSRNDVLISSIVSGASSAGTQDNNN